LIQQYFLNAHFLKGFGHHVDIFFGVYKITSVLSLHTPVIYKLFVWPIEENIKYKVLLASTKTLMNFEICTESRIRILLRLSISVIGQFSPRDHLSLDRAKVGLNMHVMGG